MAVRTLPRGPKERLMNRTLLILTGEGAGQEANGGLDAAVRRNFLRDTIALAESLRNVRTRICGPGELAVALPPAIASGPTAILTSDVPHLPQWRLRDAFTYLEECENLVIGPAESGSWYLLGLPPTATHQLHVLARPNAGLARIAAAALAAGLHVTTLPPWYRIHTRIDLVRLADDLRPMPDHALAHTRAIIGIAGMQARALGE